MTLFHHLGSSTSSNSSTKCPLPADPESYLIKPVPIAGPFTLQQLLLIICAGCSVLTIFISHFLAIKHLHHYTVPEEQKQIIRIIFTPIVYATFNTVSIIDYKANEYIQPLIAVWETIALASLFLLFVIYVAPDKRTRTMYFANLENRKAKGWFGNPPGYDTIPGGCQTWFERSWFFVFIYVVVNVVMTAVEEISQATNDFCSTSWSPRFTHIWVTVINSGFLGVAVTAIFKFYGRMKREPDFACHRAGMKLISFKIIVLLNFVQKFIFGEIKAKTSSHMTGYDLRMGIPAVVVAGEQILFAIFFHYSFASHEYRHPMKGDKIQEPMGIFRAAAHAFNPTDLIMGIVTAIKYIPSMMKQRSDAKAQAGQRSGNYHLEPLSNQQNGDWSPERPAPMYKVNGEYAPNTRPFNGYMPAAENEYVANQPGYMNRSEESYIGAGYESYKQDEETMHLAKNAR